MFKSTSIGWDGWLTGILLFLVPILLIFFLGSQMAYSQVKGQFEPYQHIPEVSNLSALAGLPAGQVVMLRGQISEATPRQELDEAASDLIVFQVRPADGREVRFQEEFPLVFPEFVMELPDGIVAILPSPTRERVIQNELHRLTDGEYEQTGFMIGDTVTVQGQWQPDVAPALAMPGLHDATGISGGDKNSLLASWQSAFQKVSWTRNILGILTLIGSFLLIGQLRRTKRKNTQEEQEPWPSQETKTIPST